MDYSHNTHCFATELVHSAFAVADNTLVYSVCKMVFLGRRVPMILSTHGFAFAANSKGIRKVFVIGVTLTSFAFGLSQIVGTFKTFLQFDAKSALTVDEFESIELPAITICPASVYKRSEVGNQPNIFASAYSYAYGNSLVEAMQIASKLCLDPNAPNHLIDFTNITDVKRVFFDSMKTVMQCKLNGKVFNCSRMFLNKETELAFCSTFNQGANVMSQYAIDGMPLSGMWQGYDSFGTSPNESKTVIMRSGMRNSLQILFNINTSQTCIPVAQYLSGMLALAHNPRIEPFLSTKPLTLLPPGFVTNVAITFRRNQRNTESIGKCRSRLDMKWYPTTKDYINKDAYIINCLTTIVVKKCNCVPYFASNLAKYVQNFSGPFCGDSIKTIAQSDCMKESVNTEYLIDRTCYHGNPIPCEEYVVNSNSVSKLYPSPNMLTSLKRSFNLPHSMNLTEFRQNFLLANFYVKRNKMIKMTENPAMTWIDLLNKAGGTMGMCLGMSLISIAELLTLVPLSFLSWFQRMCANYANYIGLRTTPIPQYRP